jgi:hypothetical protein
MRGEISKVYPGPKWKEKVKKMSDSQILAIYNSFKNCGKFKKKEVAGY